MLILVGVTINFAINGGLFNRAKEAVDRTKNAMEEEQALINEILDGTMNNSNGNNGTPDEIANAPELKPGMIPVYYDAGEQVWKKADETNTDNNWYNYGYGTNENKKWANVVLVSNAVNSIHGYRTAEIGTEIPMKDIEAFFVWIPRYAYSITDGYKTENSETVTETNSRTPKIDVTFVEGTTNRDSNGITYETDYNAESIPAGGKTPKIVHPGFTFGTQELTGLWMGKFEISGKTSFGEYVGNGTHGVNAQENAPDGTTHIQIKPGATSWRYIKIGDLQYRSSGMSNDTANYGLTNTTVDTHLIKNSEWGAAAYLSYSKYGQVPQINGAGKLGTPGHLYDLTTGAGPVANGDETRYETYTEGTHGYNTTLGKLASTTGNVYGIYDMSGGAWEYTAGYLDNGHAYIDTYGNGGTTYFTGRSARRSIYKILG